MFLTFQNLGFSVLIVMSRSVQNKFYSFFYFTAILSFWGFNKWFILHPFHWFDFSTKFRSGSGTTITKPSAREPSSVSPTIKPRWYGRGKGVSYAIVQHSPSCVWAAAVGAACSRSGAAVAAGPVDASEGGIHATKNCVAGGIEPKTSALLPC
jgi:hypothetical protein